MGDADCGKAFEAVYLSAITHKRPLTITSKWATFEEVSKVAMGYAADAIHDHYRGLDAFAFHEEHAKLDTGIDDSLLEQK